MRNQSQSVGIAVIAVLAFGASPIARAGDMRVAEAAMHREAAAVRTLLQQGADVNGAQGDGMTALHWAAANDDGGLAAILLRAGAKVDAGTRIGNYTALHVAAKEGHAAVVRALVGAHANVHATTATGATALHFAASSGNVETITLLLDHGADVNAREPAWEQTPLMFAAALGRTDAVRALVGRGADVRAVAKVVDISAR